MVSPAGTEPYNEDTYDPYNMRDPEKVTEEKIEEKKMKYILELTGRKGHPYELPDKLPTCLFMRELRKRMS